MDTTLEPRGFARIPDIKGLAEKVKHILTQYNIRTALKPVRTLANVFLRTHGGCA